MSLFLDRKYVSFLGSRLERFKQKNEYLYNFRCPICKDSQTDLKKARGYIFRKKDGMFFHCHNCHASLSFYNFLKQLDDTLAKDYAFEKFTASNFDTSPKRQSFADSDEARVELPFVDIPLRINLPRIEDLNAEHIAKKYLMDRKIPKTFFSEIYFASCFKSFLDEILPGNDKDLPKNEQRIVLPFFDKENNLLGFQGRALQKSKIKYITIKLREENKKIFGWNRLNTSKRIYVVEGPFDSLFLENAIATMDSNLYVAPRIIGSNLDYVFVFDNEPRNKEIVRDMKRTIDLGYDICIWPKDIKEKDINEMVLAGYTGAMLQSIIDANTFSDIKALINFNLWKKV
jgi:hypothetical protein